MHKEIVENKNLCQCQEDLLHLIETEDVFNILSQENMEGFNELMKYELITVKDDKVYLTPLGKEAQIHGVNNVIARKNAKVVATQIPAATSFKSGKTFLIWSIAILFLSLLFFVFQYIWQ